MSDEHYDIIVEPHVTHDTFLEIAAEEGWKRVRRDPPDARGRWVEHWLLTDDMTTLRWIEDPAVDFVVVRSEGPWTVGVARAFGGRLATRYNRVTIGLDVQATKYSEEREPYVYPLVALSRADDEEVMEWFRVWTRGGTIELAVRVVEAIGWAGWVDAIPFLKELQEFTLSDDVYDAISKVLEQLRADA